MAVNRLSLQVKDQEFLVIFGPAGAGKSTTLRLIAGVIKPNHGEIRYNGRSYTDIPPEHRNMSMVFENYALYSHMSVYDNMAFPLKARKLSTAEIKKRITRMAGILQIEDLLEQAPRLFERRPAPAGRPWAGRWSVRRMCTFWMNPSHTWTPSSAI